MMLSLAVTLSGTPKGRKEMNFIAREFVKLQATDSPLHGSATCKQHYSKYYQTEDKPNEYRRDRSGS